MLKNGTNETTLKQFTHSQSVSKSFTRIIALLLLVFLFAVVGGYVGYWYGVRKTKLQFEASNQQFIQPPLATPTLASQKSTNQADETVGWKVYKSLDNRFSFKYPPNLSVKPGSSDTKILFNTSGRNPNSFVLNIGVSLYDSAAYTSLRERYSNTNRSLPKTEKYTDSQGRSWITLGPIPIAGASNFEAELNKGKKVAVVSIQVSIPDFEQYLGKKLVFKTDKDVFDYSPLIKEHQRLAHQILSTFRF